ncbi:MAG: HDIG domain-containing protein [candidate division WOR-3 bacterium]|nr:HDIG domain-containing protein [candidate division WOR-3 bacterium]MCX7836354.1 HDIG domain-containing protein [candidate division WOR-3 bacterium]MDW8113541.1 HDIG domain-containing protein [candidate division WOR-3 bacterium]
MWFLLFLLPLISFFTYLFTKRAWQKRYEEEKRKIDEYKKKIEEENKKETQSLIENLKKELEIEKTKILQEYEKKLNELTIKRKELEEQINLCQKKEKEYLSYLNRIQNKENEILTLEKIYKVKIEYLDKLINEYQTRLLKIPNLSIEEIKEELKKIFEKEVWNEHFEELKKIKEKSDGEIKIIAQKMILEACQKFALPTAKEYSVSWVEVPEEELKGKLIGRKGRNIHLIENLTGAEIIIDDTPKKIFIFSFNPKRRMLAKLLIKEIINEKEISTEIIEKTFKKILEEFEEKIFQIGLDTCKELGIENFPKELIKLIGEMEFHITYGQNLLSHSKEVAILGKNLAINLGLNPLNVLKSGLLHDIGKILPNQENLPHQVIGANFVKNFGENEIVVQSILNHHQSNNFPYPECYLISLANSLSHLYGQGRAVEFDKIFKRLTKIEELCEENPEVKKAYVFQLGREIRILLNINKLDEKENYLLIRNLQQKIRNELDMLGEIKINLIYEL